MFSLLAEFYIAAGINNATILKIINEHISVTIESCDNYFPQIMLESSKKH